MPAPTIVLTAGSLLAILSITHGGVESSPAAGLVRGPNQPANQPTTTSELSAIGVIDDPLNSATTNGNTDESSWDDICVRCYDKVKIAQDMVQVYDNISRKQKKLISRKRAAAEAAEAAMNAATANTNRPRSNKFNRSANTSANNQNSTVRRRTLENQPELIVVSRLRVARSAAVDGQVQQQHPPNKDKYWLNKKDVELERLKREQQRQKDITCKSLLDVRYCLDQLTRECIGNLQFHSYEVFSDQLYERLRCPYPNNPNMKPLPGLSFKSISDEPKMPVARPMSSPEEVRRRLQELLPDRAFPRPLGVMLKPTMSNPMIQHQMQSVEQMKGSYRHLTQPHYIGGDDSLTVGRILLVPACFAILIALIAALHYKRPWKYEKNNGSEEQEY